MSGEENDFYRFDDFSLDAAQKVLQHHLCAQLSALWGNVHSCVIPREPEQILANLPITSGGSPVK